MLSIRLTFIYLFEQNILIKRRQSNIHTWGTGCVASAATWLERVGDSAASSAVGSTTFSFAVFTAGSALSAAWSAAPVAEVARAASLRRRRLSRDGL